MHLVVVLGSRIHRCARLRHRRRGRGSNAPRLVCTRHTRAVVRRITRLVRHRILWATALTICVVGPRSVALTCRAPRYMDGSWLWSPARHPSSRAPVVDWLVRPVTWTTREHMHRWLDFWSFRGLALHLTSVTRRRCRRGSRNCLFQSLSCGWLVLPVLEERWPLDFECYLVVLLVDSGLSLRLVLGRVRRLTPLLSSLSAVCVYTSGPLLVHSDIIDFHFTHFMDSFPP
jgi:hypothetical protein